MAEEHDIPVPVQNGLQLDNTEYIPNPVRNDLLVEPVEDITVQNGLVFEQERNDVLLNDVFRPTVLGATTMAHDGMTRTVMCRNLAAFWLLGLTNNFGYVVMLSAAHHILTPNTDNSTVTPVNRTGHLIPIACNPIGTGAVLMADILPALIVKLTAPFYILLLPYWFKLSLVVVLSTTSYLLVSFGASTLITVAITGVVFASAASGFGEYTLLGLSSHYNKNVVSTFSSGTGAAGLLGALSYAALTSLAHLSAPNTLLIMICIPVFMAVTYSLLLVKSTSVGSGPLSSDCAARCMALCTAQCAARCSCCFNSSTSTYSMLGASDAVRCETAQQNDCHVSGEDELPGVSGDELVSAIQQQQLQQQPQENVSGSTAVVSAVQVDLPLTPKDKLKLFQWLLGLMLPLMAVYFCEYFINQGLLELLYFEESFLKDVNTQYTWYQVIYQLGVFISRSSVNIIYIKYTAIFPILQAINVMLLVLQIFFGYLKSIGLIFAIVFFEGLLGGAAYANTFYRIAQETEGLKKEWCMGVCSVADSFGISIAAAVAIPVHDLICQL